MQTLQILVYKKLCLLWDQRQQVGQFDPGTMRFSGCGWGRLHWGGIGKPGHPGHAEPPTERVQQELDTVLGTTPAVCYEDRERLPYTRAVLHEVQRLSSVVAVGAVRQCVTSTHVRGYYMPKVGVPAWPHAQPSACRQHSSCPAQPSAIASTNLPVLCQPVIYYLSMALG